MIAFIDRRGRGCYRVEFDPSDGENSMVEAFPSLSRAKAWAERQAGFQLVWSQTSTNQYRGETS